PPVADIARWRRYVSNRGLTASRDGPPIPTSAPHSQRAPASPARNPCRRLRSQDGHARLSQGCSGGDQDAGRGEVQRAFDLKKLQLDGPGRSAVIRYPRHEHAVLGQDVSAGIVGVGRPDAILTPSPRL